MFVIIYFLTVTDDVDVLMVRRLFLAERRFNLSWYDRCLYLLHGIGIWEWRKFVTS